MGIRDRIKFFLFRKMVERELTQRRKKGMPVFEWKKLFAAVLAVVITFFGETFGLSGDQLSWVITTIVGYLVGQGLADMGKGKEVARIKAKAKGISLG